MNERSFRSVLALFLIAITLLSSCATKKHAKTTEEGTSSLPSSGSTLPSKTPSEGVSSAEPTVSDEPSSSTSSDPVITGELRFAKESISIKKGSSFAMSAAFPEGTDHSAFVWYSSDESIAKVDEKGNVTAQKSGYAMIAAVSPDGSTFDYLHLQVVSYDTDITSLSFESNTLSLALGATKTLALKYEPQSAPFSNFVFSSADPSVVSISDEGKITALKKGSAIITVIAPNGKTSSVTVTVTDVVNKVTSLQFEKTSAQLKAGESLILKVTVLPENADNKNLTFSSSNTSVATVDNDGTVYGLRGGTVTITAYSHDKKVSADCTVTVEKQDDPMDDLDLSNAKVDHGQEGYNGGLRVKSSDEIMFSPNLDLFRLLVSKEDYDNYIGYIRFTAKSDKEYVFVSVQVEPKAAKGDWVDFFLMGDGIDCGFCPTADAVYRVELALVNKKTGKAEFYSDFANLQANRDLKDSPYYNPTENGGQPAGPTIPMYTLTYKAVGGGIVIGDLSQTLKQGTQGTAIIAFPLPGYRFNSWNDGSTYPVRQGDYAYETCQISASFISEKGAVIPTMHITTESGEPVLSKTYEKATLVISGAADSKWNIAATLQIRGRGNSSWNGSAGQSSYDSKNSYRIKLDEKEQLLGIGDSKNKDWVLNSNKFDLSGLRNKLIWDFAERMGTLTYVTDCTWVQLYINGEYRGMYMVTELIETANDRVEIDETITKPEDKGYLIEIDFRGNYEDTPYFYIDGYGVDPDQHLHTAREFVIKNDGEVTDADVAYIKSYIEQCHAALMSGDKAAIENLVDLPSLIDMYILEELGKDVDVGAASFFIHKKEGGKLYFTAPWDFDFGFGTYGPGVSNWGLVSEGDEGCDWFAALIEHEWFVKAVAARMDELRPEFEATIKAIEELSIELEGAADMNANHWDMYGNKFHSYVSSDASSNLFTYREHIDFLIEWSTERYDILYDMISNYY